MAKGHEVVVIAPFDQYSSFLEELGATLINVDIDSGGLNPFKDLKTFWQFLKVFQNSDVEVVLNFTPKNNIYSTLAAKLHGIKVINNIAGLGLVFINESLTSKIAKFLYRVSQKYADKIFFQNEDDRSLFLKSGLATRAKTARLPGSGVDLQRFKVAAAADDDVVRFLLVARMLFDKGIGQYVEAARALKSVYGNSVEFNLLGFLDLYNPSAVSTDQMQKWVDEGAVNYLGTSDCVENEIARVDCMVLPSFYREGVPKSLLEAGAMGKPIVTTDSVGCRETVDHGVNGFLCAARSSESLIYELDKIIKMSHEERLAMGRNSRSKMELEFDEQLVVERYIKAIAELLGHGSTSLIET